VNPSLPGLDLDRVTQWARTSMPALVAPLSASLIAGGRSNLTYLLVGADARRWVLRRPPLGHVLATAHDMGREFRILSALRPTDVPVPTVHALCQDAAVNDAPFYVMEYIEGPILASRDQALAYPLESRHPLSLSMIDVLGRIHEVDPQAVGLGELGRREGYIQRQLKRWHAQIHQSPDDDLQALDEIHRRLVDTVPPQRWTGIVHGDFRIGNMIAGAQGQLRAVLDWELATLGDVLADVAWLLISWVQEGEPSSSAFTPASSAPGFATRAELVRAYEWRTGRDLSDLPFYIAFASWRSACISTGVLARYRADAMGEIDFDIDQHARSIDDSAQRAFDALDGALL
jgi:aminoglycoside phosphotransferase (APT) family kinase protein